MRKLPALACVILIFGLASPAFAHNPCGGGRCAIYPRIVTPHKRLARGHACRAPSGWGWYLRQKLYHDCSPPLVVIDELGGVTLTREY
jgi:hypothetical protein